MRILGIETSCDETALSVVEADGGIENPRFSLVGSTLFSQIEIHKPYGGVFPALAKREHAKNLIPLFKQLLKETKTERPGVAKLSEEKIKKVSSILEREYNLLKEFLDYIQSIEKPNIDAIAVTYGPGLEPALWVGVNFAKALGLVWDVPVIPTNHMEGHIISPLMASPLLLKERVGTSDSEAGVRYVRGEVPFPALALLISGGHTELVLVKKWGNYEIIGQTLDDAVGEAFDKTARLLGLPYPGGPEISKLAHEARSKKYPQVYSLPRPMLTSNDYRFSFSGLKTAVLYTLQKNPATTHELRADLAREFEDAVTEVLLKKTSKALQEYAAQSLIIGGGVIANKHLREAFTTLAKDQNIPLLVPEQSLSTDNATMIAMAGYVAWNKGLHTKEFTAQGNAQISTF